MAKAKKSYRYFGVNLPRKLAAKFEFHLAAARRSQPYQTITKSGFMAHIVGEWTSILESPDYVPSVAVPARRMVRPKPQTTPNGNARLTPAKVRKIRKDTRSVELIARDMNVNPSTIARARSGETWAWVI